MLLGALALVVAACSEETKTPAPASDAGPDAIASLTDGGADDAASAVCTDGRRRCVDMDLEVCDVSAGGWILLQSCLAGEWCDVAVGVCRPVDAGPAK